VCKKYLCSALCHLEYRHFASPGLFHLCSVFLLPPYLGSSFRQLVPVPPDSYLLLNYHFPFFPCFVFHLTHLVLHIITMPVLIYLSYSPSLVPFVCHIILFNSSFASSCSFLLITSSCSFNTPPLLVPFS